MGQKSSRQSCGIHNAQPSAGNDEDDPASPPPSYASPNAVDHRKPGTTSHITLPSTLSDRSGQQSPPEAKSCLSGRISSVPYRITANMVQQQPQATRDLPTKFLPATAGVFDTRLIISFEDVALLMQTNETRRTDSATQITLRYPAQSSIRATLPYSTRTTSDVIKGDLYLHSTSRFHALSAAQLYQAYVDSKPESWFRPCQHLRTTPRSRTSIYLGIRGCTQHEIELRNNDINFGEFMTICQQYGGFAHHAALVDSTRCAREQARKQRGSKTVVSCQYCHTDYDVHAYTSLVSSSEEPVAVDKKKEKRDTKEYTVAFDVWHNLGSGIDARTDKKWNRIARSNVVMGSGSGEAGLGMMTDRLNDDTMRQYCDHRLRCSRS